MQPNLSYFVTAVMILSLGTCNEGSVNGKGLCSEHPVTSSYDLPDSIPPSLNHYLVAPVLAHFTPAIPNALKEFSLCFWIYYDEDELYDINAFTYSPPRNSNTSNFLVFGFAEGRISVTIGGISESIPNDLDSQEWSHVCVIRTGENDGETIVYVNGKPQTLKINPGFVLPKDGYVYVLQDQIKPFNKENPTDGFKLKMAGVEMYSKALTKDNVTDMTLCNYSSPEDVLIGENTEFQQSG